jgi:23S rRNA pseudouridine2605 synthase
MAERIAKFIASTGHCSRRKAEALILQGFVKVNGKYIDTPVTLVDEKDTVEVEGKVLSKIIEQRVWILNKPEGYVCTTKDELGRKTIFDLLPKEMKNLHYVGRLDLNSEGLLLLTNSPDVKRFYELPSNKIPRVYLARVFGRIPRDMFELCKKGIPIADEKTGKKIIHTAVIENYKLNSEGGNTWIKITLKEGKNREIRKICEYFDLKVSRLKRISFGDFHLGSIDKGNFIEV